MTLKPRSESGFQNSIVFCCSYTFKWAIAHLPPHPLPAHSVHHVRPHVCAFKDHKAGFRSIFEKQILYVTNLSNYQSYQKLRQIPETRSKRVSQAIWPQAFGKDQPKFSLADVVLFLRPSEFSEWKLLYSEFGQCECRASRFIKMTAWGSLLKPFWSPVYCIFIS